MCSGQPGAGRGANMASPPIVPGPSGYQNPNYGGGPPMIGPAGGGASPGSGGFQNPGGGLSFAGSNGASPGSGGPAGIGGPVGFKPVGGAGPVGIGGPVGFQPAGSAGPAGLGGPTGFRTGVAGPTGIDAGGLANTMPVQPYGGYAGNDESGRTGYAPPVGLLGGPTGYQTMGGGSSGQSNGGNMNIGTAGPVGRAGAIANYQGQIPQQLIGPNGQPLVRNQNAEMNGAPPGYAPGLGGGMVPLYGRGNHTFGGMGGARQGSGPDSDPSIAAAYRASENAAMQQRIDAQRAAWSQQMASPAYQQQLADFYRNSFAAGGPYPTTKG